MSQKPSQRIGYYPKQTPLESSKPQKHINPLRAGLLLLCVIVFVSCFFLLVRYGFHILRSRNASRKLETIHAAVVEQLPSSVPTVSPTPSPTSPLSAKPTPVSANKPVPTAELWPSTYANNPTLRVSPVFYQLQAQNKDIVGWLKIDGMLEEAVVQRDNDYYLTHNALKQRSATGALFLDENCNLDTVPTQMLIHGHNMKEGAMFGSLKKYKVKDASFYRQHPFIDFNTLYENGRYVIFSVAEVDIRAGKPDYLPFWQQSRFSNAESFMQYVERAKLLSQYVCKVDVQPGDRLLTLSTCTGNDDNKRLIVMARKLRENENEFELNMSILSTGDR